VVHFLFAIIEHFLLALTVQTYKKMLVEVSIFQRGVGTLSANFR